MTDTPKIAKAIIEQVKKDAGVDKTTVREYHVKDPKNVQAYCHKLLKTIKYRARVKVSIAEGVLWVIVRELSYVENLERLLRISYSKLNDENLKEEIYYAVF